MIGVPRSQALIARDERVFVIFNDTVLALDLPD
jgi:hypothetical protein